MQDGIVVEAVLLNTFSFSSARTGTSSGSAPLDDAKAALMGRQRPLTLCSRGLHLAPQSRRARELLKAPQSSARCEEQARSSGGFKSVADYSGAWVVVT